MSWPATDFELEIQCEINNLRALAKSVSQYLGFKPNGGETFRKIQEYERLRENLERAYRDWNTGTKADI